MTGRAPVADHVLVRLADEGVPLRVLARAFQRPFDEVFDIIRDARDAGHLLMLPASDWPSGSRREDRSPTVAPLRRHEFEDRVWALMGAFRLTQTEARCLAALMQRGQISKPSLHLAMSPGPEPETEMKLVDVMICKVRKKLKPHRITIETLWGRGYQMTRENSEAVLAVVSAHQDRCDGAAGKPERVVA